MNYFKDTFKYIASNFPVLLLFSCLPAIVLSMTSNIWKFLAFFANPYAASMSFINIYRSFSFMFGESALLGLLGIFVIAFFTSLCYSAIERHMKIGKISIARPFARVDETILAVLPVFCSLVVVLECCALLNAAMIVLGGLISSAVAYFFAVVSTLVIYVFAILFFTQILFWIPSMIVLGYPLKSALIFSMNMISGKTASVFKHFGLMLLACGIVAGANYVFLWQYIGNFTVLMNFVIYALIFIFVVSYSMVAFFHATEETRNDLKGKKKYLT